VIPVEEHPPCDSCLERFPGELYVDGWDEWQEGDRTVSERVTRIRSKRTVRTVTSETLPTVTNETVASVSTPLSGSGKRLAEADSGKRRRSPNGGPEPLAAILGLTAESA
jgi:hypothetical protein